MAARAVARPADGPENPFQAIARSAAGALALLLVALVAGGIREELQRAFLLHRFRQDLGGPLTGLVVSSAIFGVGHVVQGWDAVLVTGALGAFWAALYLARGSIVAAVVSHALANGAQVLIAFARQRGARSWGLEVGLGAWGLGSWGLGLGSWGLGGLGAWGPGGLGWGLGAWVLGLGVLGLGAGQALESLGREGSLFPLFLFLQGSSTVTCARRRRSLTQSAI